MLCLSVTVEEPRAPPSNCYSKPLGMLPRRAQGGQSPCRYYWRAWAMALFRLSNNTNCARMFCYYLVVPIVCHFSYRDGAKRGC